MTKDCAFCCAFNSFFLQHRCYTKLQQQQTPTPIPAPSVVPKWFLSKEIERSQVVKMLIDRQVGSFYVRPSKTCGSGVFVLSVRVPSFVNESKVNHYLIIKTPNQRYRFQNADTSCTKEWSDIESLVIHHTIMREFLPCTLRFEQQSSVDKENKKLRLENDKENYSFIEHWPSDKRSTSLQRPSKKDNQLLVNFSVIKHSRFNSAPIQAACY